MHATLSEALLTHEFQDVFLFLMNHEGPLTDAFAPEEIPLISGMVAADKYPNIRSGFALDCSWKSDFELSEKCQLAGVLMYRLKKDEDALNWCVHQLLCEHHVAGSDAYLFDLIREIPVAQKLALCAATCSYWGSEELKSLHAPGLTGLIGTIATFCESTNTTKIEWLPTNENLLQTPPDATIASNGKLGISAVQLEASPLCTLPKSLLIQFHDSFDTKTHADFVKKYEHWPIASQLWLQLLFKMGSSVLNDIQVDGQDEPEFCLDGLARVASGGMVQWKDLASHEWNGYYPSSWIDHDDVATTSALLNLRPDVDDEIFDQIRNVIARLYHLSDIDDAYAGGFPDSLRIVRQIEDCPVEGVGKLMFVGTDRDPLEIIDKHLDAHQDLISSSLISRSFSECYSFPKAGIDLLSIINHTDPDKHTGLYAHAIVKMQLQTLKFLRENEPQEEFMSVMSCVRTILSNAHATIENSWPSAPALEQAYRGMPPHLQGPEARLSLGLPLTREQMKTADDKLRTSSFNIDLGL